MSKQPFLSVVIPSYNELQNLQRGALDEVIEYLKKQSYEWELILTDDGSSDGTVAELKKIAASHPHVKVQENVHAGKGPTVKAGMLEATGEWRLFTDFDQSTPLREVERLLHRASEGYEIVIGSREMVGSVRDEEPWYRHFMGRGFNWLVQMLAIPGILDTQCGFKLFSQRATEILFPRMEIYGKQTSRGDAFTGAFDVELLFLAKKLGFKIQEVPIEWHHRETNRVSPVKDSLRMLRDIIYIRIADMQGKYKQQS
jgi:dolichyl-phosphate beta-glucosyltransferase